MTPTEVIAILQAYSNWRQGGDDWPPSPNQTIKAINAAIEMLERSAKTEQALKAMTKVYKSIPYAQWPTEMHLANEVLEKSK
jgi:hypothetical protein